MCTKCVIVCLHIILHTSSNCLFTYNNNTFVFETFPAPIRGAVSNCFFLSLVKDQVEMVLQVAVLWWMS